MFKECFSFSSLATFEGGSKIINSSSRYFWCADVLSETFSSYNNRAKGKEKKFL